MPKYIKSLCLSVLLSVGFGTAVNADPVDEAAKCSATFRVLTSLELQNEALGRHFSQLAMFSYDLIGLYSEIYRGGSMTNGETSDLITDFQLKIDATSNDGSAFIPYVKSCTGWLTKVGAAVNDADQNKEDIRTVIISAPKPNLSFKYPHSDWSAMQEMFYIAYGMWSDMDKVTPRDIKKSIGN
jgi:hypothetical protein